MKILLINFEYPPLGGGGGIAMMEIAEELGKRHSVHILTSGAPGLEEEWHHPEVDVTVHRVHVAKRTTRATASFRSMLGFLPAGIRRGAQLVGELQFDVVNTWFAIPSGVVGGWISARNRVPHVLTVIGGDIYDPSKWYSPHRFAPSRWAVRWALKRADRHLAISSDIASRTRRYFDFDGFIQVVPLGIRQPVYRPASRSNLELDSGRIYIATVGRLVRRKDYPTLIRALKLLNRDDVDLLMIGDGPEQESLRSLAVDEGVSDRVHFPGFVSNEMKYQLLETSDLFVLASLHEGFGVVYLEAMFCGLPIIAADQGGQTDILEDPVTGTLVEAGNEHEMAAAIQALLDDPARRRRIAASNRERARQYSIDRIAQRFEKVFLAVAGNRQAPESSGAGMPQESGRRPQG